jgi:hypothetical protein
MAYSLMFALAGARPLPADERFTPSTVNALDQRTDPESLLNWFERLVRLRINDKT